MNDNDIIKALEFCESPTCECTSWCPMFYNGTNSKSDCRGELHKNALDLINRQKAEIERLNHIRAELSKKMDRLKDMVAQNEGVLPRYEQLIKAEAIKEFAERLKVKRGTRDELWDSQIDNLVKEMTEEQE